MSALDRTVLSSLEADLGDREVVREIVRTFLDLLPTSQGAVAEAARTDDRARLRREAHRLGSACATVGAVELLGLCRTLESAPPSGAGPGSVVGVWASCCARTTEELSAYLGGS